MRTAKPNWAYGRARVQCTLNAIITIYALARHTATTLAPVFLCATAAIRVTHRPIWHGHGEALPILFTTRCLRALTRPGRAILARAHTLGTYTDVRVGT